MKNRQKMTAAMALWFGIMLIWAGRQNGRHF